MKPSIIRVSEIVCSALITLLGSLAVYLAFGAVELAVYVGLAIALCMLLAVCGCNWLINRRPRKYGRRTDRT